MIYILFYLNSCFNALSGFQSLTGNYPGVTVEKKVGRMQCGERSVNLIDLPGTYSLSPRSLDEMVAVNVLLGRQADVGSPDVVICIADASNLERNLYLVSQVLDLPESAIEPPPSFGTRISSDFIHGMAESGKKFVIILNVDRALDAAELFNEAVGVA